MIKIPEILKKKIDSLPLLPGCYVYKDSKNEIIYVGKAVRLRNRVKSYFSNYERLDPKTRVLVRHINDFEYYIVDSEAESLILETNLIKKYRPKFNRLMIDDKSYSWIKIDMSEDFPKIKLVRKKNNDKANYFGPYPAQFPAKDVLKRLRKIFPYRSCNRTMNQSKDKVICSDTKPCLYYHIGLCNAPCASKIFKNEYRKSIYNIQKFLEGQKMDIVNNIEVAMKDFAKNHEYEKAAQLRDRLVNIKYVLTKVHLADQIDDVYISNKKDSDRQNNIKDLFEILKIWSDNLVGKDIKIECYDISNISGTNAVGSMVVMVNGIPEKSLYRKFRIKGKNTPDDFAMHQEMMRRRLKNYLESSNDISFQNLPDLMIIDGGKGQLSSVIEVLEELGLSEKINICALAKRDEEIFQRKEDKFIRIKIGKRHEALKLVQRIRDESHRFGVSYHRKLRAKQLISKAS